MLERLKKKALQSHCKYKVAAMALDSGGRVLGYSRNNHRFSRLGGSLHAEMALVRRYRATIRTIIIVRVGKDGCLLPIHPCKTCAHVAQILGIRIQTVEDIDGFD